ncbi:MAG: hypothetical protein A2032_02455 [Chloroflexi bacterium RBG_19FT_COMBO_49_13]|nr:MAG: hypothetical protein A2032_02455 [Chloroflexi bacterium RBG_19FT_COMBO_49_13]
MPGHSINYHRRSIRLNGYDYAQPGAYFITLVTNGYKCIFGKIIDKAIQINDLGKIVRECWLEIPDHFLDTSIEPFVVMPNHVQGIITIYEGDCRDTIYRAPTIEKFGQPVVGSIPTIVRTFKAAVTRRARLKLGMKYIRQRNYYEHILRNGSELESITQYISVNPDHWIDDPEYIQ